MTTYRTIGADVLEQGTLLRLMLRKPTGNVLTTGMMRELSEALREHQDDQHLRLVFLRGEGGEFSYGASIEEHDRQRVDGMLRTFHGLVREVASFPVPVAALVEGRCLGGAFELALCCHLVFAAPDARFGCPEIKLGAFAPVLAAAGADRLPGALAERLLLTGEEIGARAAADAGLVAAIFESADPEAALLGWYREGFAKLSAFALRQATAAFRGHSGLRRSLYERLPEIERQYVVHVASSHDGEEGITAFLARRPPAWKDR
jgi:cyclohexa-1,5-dienecarbonyl-CoA hydratase